MKYKLLNNNTGILITRDLTAFLGNVKFEFEGVPSNATVIFSTVKGDIYRDISDGKVCVNADKLDGYVKVTVVVIGSEKWVCEGIIARKTEGGVIIAPDDRDILQKFADVKLENDALREENTALAKRLSDVEKRIEFHKSKLITLNSAIKELAVLVKNNNLI